MQKPDLFAYLDYRKYLRDAFDALNAPSLPGGVAAKGRAKRVGRGKISYRSFAKEAGYSSPNLLQLILSGERDLSPAHVPGTVRALKLNKQEAEFFADLVSFDRAGGFDEKTFHYQRMLRSRRHAEARPIEKGQFEYLEQWYHPAVRELVAHPDFGGDPAWIARRVYPRITAAQAEKSLELLQRLGLLRRDDATGNLVQTDAQISTAPEVASLAVANYHRAVLKLAEGSLETFDGQRRDLRAVTLGIPKDKFPELKRKLEAFWREILDLAAEAGPVEEVYQVNLQAFPLTRPEAPDA
jgi:uncharacterized protein (TIGR02147 family)